MEFEDPVRIRFDGEVDDTGPSEIFECLGSLRGEVACRYELKDDIACRRECTFDLLIVPHSRCSRGVLKEFDSWRTEVGIKATCENGI